MPMQATIDVRRQIQQDLRDFSRGEIDFQALVDRVEGACSTEAGAPDIALELVEIEENEATGALQRGFLRVLKERIRQAQTQSPPPPPQAPGEHGEPVPSDDLTIPLEADESADEIIADLFPGPEDERFVPRQPLPETEVRPARVRHIEEARRRREARHGPRVGLHEPLEWPMPGVERDMRRRPKSRRSWLLFGLAGLVLLALLLKGPVEERYPDIGARISQWFSAAVAPAPPASEPGSGAPAQSSVEPPPAGPSPTDAGPQPGSSPEVGAATSSPPEVATGAPDAPVETPARESSAASDGATTAPLAEPSTTDATAAQGGEPAASAGTGGAGYFLIARPEFRVREDAGIVAITLRRAAGSAGQASVSWWTVPADALPAEDYADFGPREEVFAAGETTRVVYVPLVSDTVAEDRESFYVRIGEPTGAKLGSLTVATVTIFDDDL